MITMLPGSNERQSPFLTVDEAAEYLRLARRTLDNWRWAGAGPDWHKHGGRVVYHIDDIKAFSDRNGLRGHG